MQFNEFLELTEAQEIAQTIGELFKEARRGRGRRQTPGAFGKMSREEQKYADISRRVGMGKGMEKKIIEALKEKSGWVISPPSVAEDKVDKIDGWITTEEGKRVAIQVKYRNTGDDIAFEAELDGRDGHDMVSKAHLYIVLDQSGTKIRAIPMQDIKVIAQRLREGLLEEEKISGRKIYRTNEGEARRQALGTDLTRTKIMVYIRPEIFTNKQTFDLEKSLWES
jgi:hypothetical protein